MDFEKINSFATEVANVTFANVEKKEIIRDNIINMVAAACISYEADRSFRREINAYVDYVRRNN